MDENRNEDWKMDPKLKNIDAGKLDMLQKLAEKGSGKSASSFSHPFSASWDGASGSRFPPSAALRPLAARRRLVPWPMS